MNLTDLLVQQNNGAAVQELGRRFNLNQQQTIHAIEALMPAFSHGLKRNTRTSQGAASLIEALASGRHGQYVENPEYAGSAAGVGDGNAILGHLFGNKDVSRAVAAQAAQSTGIGSAILRKMLPVIASMVMGSLFKGSTGRGGGLGGALGQAAGGGILGQIIEGLAGGALGGATQGRQPRRRRQQQIPGSLEDLLGGLLGGGKRQRQTRRRTNDPIMPAPMPRRRQRVPQGGGQNGGLGEIFDQLAGGGTRQRQRRQNPYAPQPQRRRQRQPQRRGGGLEQIFGDMLDPGGNTDHEYRRESGSVFDQMLGN